MKPLIYLFAMMFALVSVNTYAACNEQSPSSCEQNIHRKHYVKVNYKNPVIYCKYYADERGNDYRICTNCDRNKCVKEYFFDNFCEHC